MIAIGLIIKDIGLILNDMCSIRNDIARFNMKDIFIYNIIYPVSIKFYIKMYIFLEFE